MKKKITLVSLVLLIALSAAAMPRSFAAGEEAEIGNNKYATLEEAMREASAGQTIKLLENVTLEAQLTINPGVTLDGNGKTIKADGSQTWDQAHGGDHVILFSSNSALKNVTIDGDSKKVRGVQAWQKKGVLIQNVTIKQVKNHGLKVSGSTVAIMGSFKVEDIGGWGGVGVDLDPTIAHPVFNKYISVLTVYGTKFDKNTKIGTTNADKTEYCYIDARNYSENKIEPNQLEPKCNGTDTPLFEKDNRYHGISKEGYKFKINLNSPKREFITYFNADKNGKIIDANPNAGTIIDPVKEQYVDEKHNQSAAVTLDPPALTAPAGYVLEGWTTEPNGSTIYESGQIIHGNVGDITSASSTWQDDLILYPKWKSIIHTLSYALGDHAAEGAAAPDPVNYAAGAAVTVPDAVAPDDGYEFAGWKYGGTVYQPGASFTMPGGDATLTAQWGLKNYNIVCDPNGGKFTGEDPPSTYTVESEDFTLPTPGKEGYIFEGWTGTGISGAPQKTVTIVQGSTGDRTYTAYWELIPATKYSLTFDVGQRKALGAAAPDPDSKAEGEVFRLPGITPGADGKVGADGWTFAGWKYGGTDYRPGDSFTMPGKDATLTAQWEEYTITFKVENGKFRDNSHEIELTITDGKLAPGDVPTGLIPNDGFQPNPAGWKKNGAPATVGASVNESATYTYTFVAAP